MSLAEHTESDGGTLVKRIGSYRTDLIVVRRVSSAGGRAHAVRKEACMMRAGEGPTRILREVGHD